MLVWKDEIKKGGIPLAIKRVTAELGNSNAELKKSQQEVYSGDLIAPKNGGYYSATVKAHDDAGNIAVAKSNEIEVTIWKPPKTNWKSTDRFNWKDYNRIKNNLKWLHEKVCELYKSFSVEDMGDDISSYSSYWEVKFFNAWENNLETINKNMFSQNYGQKQRFFENGAFIQWNELNRIESAILRMHDILESQESGIRRIPFRFGLYKEVRG